MHDITWLHGILATTMCFIIRNGAFEWHILVEKRHDSVVVTDNKHLLAYVHIWWLLHANSCNKVYLLSCRFLCRAGVFAAQFKHDLGGRNLHSVL